LSQLQRLDDYVTTRHSIAAKYDDALHDFPLVIPWQHPDSFSGMHLYVIRLRLEQLTHTHRQVFEALRSAGIGVNLHYIPVYRQPYYRQMGFAPASFPEAERYYTEAISLPLFPGLTTAQQGQVVAALNKALARQEHI